MRAMITRLTIIILIVLTLSNTVLAQDIQSTPAPPNYLRNKQNTVYFSEGLYSYFELTRPTSDFAAVVFKVTQPGWQGVEIVYDNIEDIVTVNEGTTYVSHLWEIPISDPPNLFRGLTLRWDFIDKFGETESWSEALLYADARTAWRFDRPDAVKVPLAIPSRAFNLDTLRESAINVYDLMSVQTGLQPELQYVFFDNNMAVSPCITDVDGDTYLRLPIAGLGTIPCDPARAEQIYIGNGYTPIFVDQLTEEHILDAMSQDMFNVFFSSLLDANASTIPAWFLDGYSRFYSPANSYQLLEISRLAERVDRNYNQMPEPPASGEQLEVWQAQAYGMVLYMADQIGIENLFTLGQRVLNGDSLVAGYEELSDQTFESIIPNWRNWIFKQSSEGDYVYDPYISATATPTFTPSDTALPPTATQTPTASLTPSRTPTLTLTFTPTITPSVTNTPTFTATFTQTPTPTETPIPADIVSEQTRQTNRQSIMNALIAGGAILIFGFLIAVILVAVRRARGNE